MMASGATTVGRSAFRTVRTSANRGFTIIEMIVAAFLLVVGVVGALTAFASAIRATRIGDETETAAMLARKQLATLETQPNSLAGGDQDGDFGDQYSAYRWTQSIETSDYPNLFRVTLTVLENTRSGSPRQWSVTTYMWQSQQQTGASGTGLPLDPNTTSATAQAGASSGP